jgi:hypothetical protein
MSCIKSSQASRNPILDSRCVDSFEEVSPWQWRNKKMQVSENKNSLPEGWNKNHLSGCLWIL